MNIPWKVFVQPTPRTPLRKTYTSTTPYAIADPAHWGTRPSVTTLKTYPAPFI